jgi:hypothetical protein
MKSIFRFGVMLLVAVMLATPVASTRAQGDTCYGVPAGDCALLNGLSGTSAAFAQGFNMDYKLDFKFNGSSAGTAQTGNVTISGTGVLGTAAAAASGGASDPSAMLSALLFSNVINYDINAGTTPQKGSVEVRVANGNVYFKADMMGPKWQYMSAADLSAIATSAMSKMPGASGAGGTGAAGGPMSAMSNPEMMAALSAIPNIPGAIVGEAVDGPSVDGQATRKITYNINLATIVAAKEFRPVLKAGLAQQAAGAEVTDAQVDDMAAKIGTALKNSKLSFYALVGSSDKILHGLGLNVAFSIDEATAKLLSPTSTTSGSGDLSLAFDITFSKVGQAVTVEAPADATKLDLGAMMGAGK